MTTTDPLDENDAVRMLAAAQAEVVAKTEALNRAIHARAGVAHSVRLRSALKWPDIGRHLGGMNGATACGLVSRYKKAISDGATLHLARVTPTNNRKQASP